MNNSRMKMSSLAQRRKDDRYWNMFSLYCIFFLFQSTFCLRHWKLKCIFLFSVILQLLHFQVFHKCAFLCCIIYLIWFIHQFDLHSTSWVRKLHFFFLRFIQIIHWLDIVWHTKCNALFYIQLQVQIFVLKTDWNNCVY